MADAEDPARRFRVVPGQWVQSAVWLDFPQTIRARPPENRDTFCKVRVSRADALKAADHRRQAVPADLVFMAYVRLDEPSDGATRGVLTHWQFVEADNKHGDLPLGFEHRYDRRHW